MAQPTVASNLANIHTLFSDYSSVLTAWETDFLKSLRRRLDAMVPLSPKQQAILDKLLLQAPERAGEDEDPLEDDGYYGIND